MVFQRQDIGEYNEKPGNLLLLAEKPDREFPAPVTSTPPVREHAYHNHTITCL